MVRPRKRRRLAHPPRSAIYKPAGVALEKLRQVLLLPEELEALRLSDLEGLSQVEAAQAMNISRSTFQRTLERAHRQVALALVEGQALRLEDSVIETRPAGARRVALKIETQG
jgi:predicted DNA-binding protein (UPF0251 family)